MQSVYSQLSYYGKAQAHYWLLLQETAMSWQHINREAWEI